MTAIQIADASFHLAVDTATGAMHALGNPADPHAMNWLCDPAEHGWMGLNHGWGLGYLACAHPGTGPMRWQQVESIAQSARAVTSRYRLGQVRLEVQRSLRGGLLHERYRFRNSGKAAAPIWGMALNVPFNDNYPDADTCVTRRCNAHVWCGGDVVWANALRMGGTGPHLGMLASGMSSQGYAVSGRGALNGGSNARGCLMLVQDGWTLEPGASRDFTLTFFWHQGWDDFRTQVAALGGSVGISADRYAVVAGDSIQVSGTGARLRHAGKAVPRSGTLRLSTPGEHVVEAELSGGAKTRLVALAVPPLSKLLQARVDYILDRQLVAAGPQRGFLVPYHTTLQAQELGGVGDHNEGRERIGMGILLAQWARLGRHKRAGAVAKRYARLVRTKLQLPDGSVRGELGGNCHRLYNYPWAARLHLELWRLDHKARHLDDAVATIRAYYAHGGAGFYPIGLDLVGTHAALIAAGRTAEASQVVRWAVEHATQVAGHGIRPPPHEVRYEQTIMTPGALVLLQAHTLTGEQHWLDAARPIIACVDAFNGRQPHHRLNDIAIRHWDGFWFGARRLWGDVFPHYWSASTAVAFRDWAKASGEDAWRSRADAILMQNLSSFGADGSATCAYIFPDHVDGEPGRLADPLANDQDWALVFLLDAAQADPAFAKTCRISL
jgi:hypothetical protein